MQFQEAVVYYKYTAIPYMEIFKTFTISHVRVFNSYCIQGGSQKIESNAIPEKISKTKIWLFFYTQR